VSGGKLYTKLKYLLKSVLLLQIISVPSITMCTNALQTTVALVHVVIDKSGSPITNDHEKANAFNNHFSSVSVVDNDAVPPCSNVPLCCILDNINISAKDVIQSVNKLKTNSSCGPDGLSPVLFKRLKQCLSEPLAQIYNQLISVGMVPDTGVPRTAHIHVVPVF